MEEWWSAAATNALEERWSAATADALEVIR